jgi:plastocyanin
MSAGEMALLIAALVMLVAGLATAAWIATAGQGTSARAHAVLAERYASGDISTEEFNERRTLLGPAMSRSRWWPLSIALIAIGVLGAIVVLAFAPDWSMMDGSMMGGDMGSMMGGGTTKRDAPAPASDADNIDVTAREFSFSPARVEVPQGETVNVSFHNDGSMFHTFTIEGEDFNLEAEPGDTVTAALDLAPGTYVFICTVSGHASSGMRGEIEVG